LAFAVQVSPELAALVNALGLVGPDGNVSTDWFGNPLDSLRTILSNDYQRAALFDLLDSVLPVEADSPSGGSRWHPLLEARHIGNVYITVDGSAVGFAVAVETPSGTTPSARASLRIPLVDVSSGNVEVIAGSAQAPLELVLEAHWAAGSHPSGIAVAASVDLQGNGSLRITLDDLDPSAAPGTVTELDPTKMDADTARVLAQLIGQALAQVSGGSPQVTRIATYFPSALGLGTQLPALPIQNIMSDPAAIRTWMAQIAVSPAAFQT
jgi:hypothetical protein